MTTSSITIMFFSCHLQSLMLQGGGEERVSGGDSAGDPAPPRWWQPALHTRTPGGTAENTDTAGAALTHENQPGSHFHRRLSVRRPSEPSDGQFGQF